MKSGGKLTLFNNREFYVYLNNISNNFLVYKPNQQNKIKSNSQHIHKRFCEYKQNLTIKRKLKYFY